MTTIVVLAQTDDITSSVSNQAYQYARKQGIIDFGMKSPRGSTLIKGLYFAGGNQAQLQITMFMNALLLAIADGDHDEVTVLHSELRLEDSWEDPNPQAWNGADAMMATKNHLVKQIGKVSFKFTKNDEIKKIMEDLSA
jgi:hypothetical protein